MSNLNFEFKNIRRFMSSHDDPIVKNRYVSFLVEVKNLPENLLTGANPRHQNTEQKIYQAVKQSFLDGIRRGDKTPFHLKNQGLDILATALAYKENEKSVVVTVKKNQVEGLFNGGHTYKIILDNRDNIKENTYVEVKIWTQLPEGFHVPMAQARNRSVQVTESSILNQDGCFDWVKEALDNTEFLHNIGFVQNEPNKYMDIKKVLSLMAALDPSAGSDDDDKRRHLANIYKSKQSTVNRYRENINYYKKFKYIIKDILYLHDYIQVRSQELWNEDGGKAGSLKIFNNKATTFAFIKRKSNYKLDDAILYPILSSFRYLIKEDGDGFFTWKVPFTKVLEIFDSLSNKFLKISYNAWKDEGCNMSPVGSNKGHWDCLYRTMEAHCLRDGVFSNS